MTIPLIPISMSLATNSILSDDNATMSTAMLRRDEIEQLESTDETEYTDYGAFVAALSGLTGVVSVNSQHGRKDKPIREKTQW